MTMNGEDDDLFTSVNRVGRPRSGDNRILKVVCRGQKAKKNILRKAKLLKSNALLHTMYRNSDRTPMHKKNPNYFERNSALDGTKEKMLLSAAGK